MDKQVVLSPSQSVQIMAIAALLKQGDIDIRGYDSEEADLAIAAIKDIGEEAALQLVGQG